MLQYPLMVNVMKCQMSLVSEFDQSSVSCVLKMPGPWHHDTSQGGHKQWTTVCVPDSYFILKYTYSEASLLVVDKALCIRIRSLNRLSGVFCIWYPS